MKSTYEVIIYTCESPEEALWEIHPKEDWYYMYKNNWIGRPKYHNRSFLEFLCLYYLVFDEVTFYKTVCLYLKDERI